MIYFIQILARLINLIVDSIDSNFVLDSSYPILTSSIFRDWSGSGTLTLPDNLDTILYLPQNGITFFFKGYLYWRSSKLFELEEGYPRFISQTFGLNVDNGFQGKLDASFIWGGNNQAYFVEGRNYWRFSFETGTIDSIYPKDLMIWKGLPEKITDALLWTNGVTYFFDNDKYYRFNDDQFTVEKIVSIYPRFNLKTWFNCYDNIYQRKSGQLVLKETQTDNTAQKNSTILNMLKINYNKQLISGSIQNFCFFNNFKFIFMHLLFFYFI